MFLLRLLGLAFFMSLGSRCVYSLEVLRPEGLQDCLSYNEEASAWTSTCSLEVLTQFADSHSNNFDPSLRYLLGRVLQQEVRKIHGEILTREPRGQKGSRMRSVREESSSHSSPSSGGWMQYLFGALEPEAHLEPRFDPEAVLLGRTRPWVDLAEKWLLPVLEKQNLTDFEAAFLLVMIYGDSLRFSKAQEFIKQYQNVLFKYRVHRKSLLERASYWVGEFGAYPIRDWVLQELVRWRSPKIEGRTELDFFFWTESLRLSGLPQNTPDRKLLLDQLERLWLVYPREDQRQKLRDLASLLRVSPFFKPPTPADLNLGELIEAAEAWVRVLDGERAQKVLDHVFRLPSWKRKDQDQLWEAFKLHVKIYRILDQRPRIPALIQRYLQLQRYLRFHKDAPNLAVDISRALQIANWFWTYERTEEARKILRNIVEFNRRHNMQHSLGEAEYYLARISEQSFAKKAAIQDLTNSLKWGLGREFKSFVLWRRLFLKWELSQSVQELEVLRQDLAELKPLISDDSEALQWRFWAGRLEAVLGQKKAARDLFEKTYSEDSFSFYGALSGLALKELGHEPKGWQRKAKKENRAPEWTSFFNTEGKTKDPQFYSLARVYFLARSGFRQEAEEFFSSLDASAWRYILDKSQSKSSRLKFSRAVAYLRYSLGDPMGALRMGEISRQAFVEDIEAEEIAHLYPLAFWEDIQEQAAKRSVNPWIVASLIRQESAFNPKARSWANALGLMQMIPPVAEEEARIAGMRGFQPEMLFDPKLGVSLGTQHLAGLLNKLDSSLICAFAAYNAGLPPVEKWRAYYPKSDPLMFIERISYKETRNYVQKLLRNYINYQRFYGDAQIRPSELLRMPGQKPVESVIHYESTNWSSNK